MNRGYTYAHTVHTALTEFFLPRVGHLWVASWVELCDDDDDDDAISNEQILKSWVTSYSDLKVMILLNVK